MEEQINMWNEGSSIEDMKESRCGANITCNNPKIIKDVSIILNRVASKSERLIGNFTTNLAECWMHIRTKFDGGKMYNHCNRGSWHTRCYAGALRVNEGPKWSPAVWTKATGTTAGENFDLEYERREKCVENNNTWKNTKESKLKRWKRKVKSNKESSRVVGRREYGKEARDVEPDMCQEELNKNIEKYMEKEINISNDKINSIEKETRDQSQCDIWKKEKKSV